jgi:gluconokinase
MRVLALDLGTSSVRAALFDRRGSRIPGTTAQRTWPLRTDASGMAVLDPAVVAREAEAVLLEAAGHADGPIAAVGTSCFWHSLIALDARGGLLTPIITWADSRCAADAARLRRRLDEREIHARTGCMLRASFWPAKLAWLRRTDPARFRRIARLLSPAEWLYRRWTGGERCAHGMATATGLYDPAAKTWDPGMLRALGLGPEQLPAISDAPLATGADLAARCPALAGAAWIPAIGDGAANNLGAGAVRPGLAAINFGTTGAIRIVRDRGRPRAPFGLFCYRIDERRFLVGGAISNAGGLRQWCIDTLRLPESDAIEAALGARPGPDHGLRVLPFWLAERAPTWREDLSGAITGIRQSTTPMDLLQAITEATFHRLATIADRVPGRSGLTAIVGGGIQRSPASLQRLADVTGLPLIACDDPETSLRGAAVFALERCGGAPAGIGGRAVRPRTAPAARYRRERRELARLEAALFP